MRKLSFITAIAALLCIHQTTWSQTMTANEKQLESAVKIYNELNTFIDHFGGENKMALSDLYAIDADVEKGLVLLDDLIKKESGEILKTANYFRTNFLYQQAFAYGIYGNNAAAYTKFKAIANEINALTSSSFPFRYKFEEKNYIINWENFSLTLGEFYAAMAELGGINGDDDESLRYARLSLNYPQSTAWYKFVSLVQILKIKEKKQQYDQETVDISLQHMNQFALLDEESKKSVETYNFPDYTYSWNLLATAIQRNPALSNNGYYYAQATSVFKKMADDRSLSDAYMKAVNAGYSDRGFYLKPPITPYPKIQGTGHTDIK
ncbi:MAG: hypothetical protein IPN33_16585 [Saprospiraceae bacterium]|nr:hypothetical protein [Saprospiraceae bacterium]